MGKPSTPRGDGNRTNVGDRIRCCIGVGKPSTPRGDGNIQALLTHERLNGCGETLNPERGRKLVELYRRNLKSSKSVGKPSTPRGDGNSSRSFSKLSGSRWWGNPQPREGTEVADCKED